MIHIIGIIIIWVMCGILAYGYNFGYYQREYPSIAENDYSKDRIIALISFFFGPIALSILICTDSTKHGLKFK